jgi:hypothetical protein
MTELPNSELIEKLAAKLAARGQRTGSAAILHAEGGDNWAGGSIFVDGPRAIEWISPDNGELQLIMRLWDRTPANKKWRGITMLVIGDEFRIEFDYGEGWSEDEDEGDRRLPIVRAHFGDKPIYYPPLEDAGSRQ